MNPSIRYLSQDKMIYLMLPSTVKLVYHLSSQQLVFIEHGTTYDFFEHYSLGWWEAPYWNISQESVDILKIPNSAITEAINRYHQLETFK